MPVNWQDGPRLHCVENPLGVVLGSSSQVIRLPKPSVSLGLGGKDVKECGIYLHIFMPYHSRFHKVDYLDFLLYPKDFSTFLCVFVFRLL